MDAAGKYWQQMASELRRALGYAPLTIEEAEAEMAKAEPVPMTDEEIERIVDYATGETELPPKVRELRRIVEAAPPPPAVEWTST